MPGVTPAQGLDEQEAAPSGLWAMKVGYKAASKQEMQALAALPFLSYPSTPLLLKELSAQALPQVCSAYSPVREPHPADFQLIDHGNMWIGAKIHMYRGLQNPQGSSLSVTLAEREDDLFSLSGVLAV